MNDEKTAIVNMVSEGTITTSEGIALLEVLYGLEDMGPYEGHLEAENPEHLPPWSAEEADVDVINERLRLNECARAIAVANKGIVVAIQQSRLEDAPMMISALDVAQISKFRPTPEQNANGGFSLGCFYLKRVDGGLRRRGGGIHGTWRGMRPEMQLSVLPPFFRLEHQTDEAIDKETKNQTKTAPTVENSDVPVITKAGTFGDCLKLTADTIITWLALNVGIVKFLNKYSSEVQTEIELVDYDVQGGEPSYFPLSSGNSWRYQWQDKSGTHQEIVRVILHVGDGVVALSCANHAGQIT